MCLHKAYRKIQDSCGIFGPPWCLGVVFLTTAWTNFAHAAFTLYAVDTTCHCLSSIEPTSGDRTEIGLVGEDFYLTNMAVDVDGAIYVVDNQQYCLLTIDVESGEGTCSTGVGMLSNAIAIAPVPVPGASGVFSAGTLFAGKLIPSASDDLVVIDKIDGSTTTIAHLNTYYYGLDFRADGVLFGAGSAAPFSEGMWQLLTINTATGEETLIGTLTIPGSEPYVGALVFTPDGQLLMSGTSNGQDVIWEVDQNTAALSNPVVLSSTCCDFPQGLGFISSPPINVEALSWGRLKGIYR